jgi:hypothetical protein
LALEAKMVFVDIRRQNMLELLLYNMAGCLHTRICRGS